MERGEASRFPQPFRPIASPNPVRLGHPDKLIHRSCTTGRSSQLISCVVSADPPIPAALHVASCWPDRRKAGRLTVQGAVDRKGWGWS